MRLPVRTGLLVVLVAAVVVPLALAVSGGDMITTIAGTGTAGFTGDGGQATSAQLSSPFGVAVDAQGDFYIADAGNNRVRKVSGGVITTVAGTGTPGYSGDGGQATSAQLQIPSDVAVDGQGNLYIADYGNQRIRRSAAGSSRRWQAPALWAIRATAARRRRRRSTFLRVSPSTRRGTCTSPTRPITASGR